jgi:UDP-N-acetylmuramoyl-L-alanyl-D-glutamate--2,6-diaminopimelate ligase
MPASFAPVDTAVLLEALRSAGLLAAQSSTLPATVSDVVDDSRQVTPGSAFLAVTGATQDGHQWVEGAAAAGAAVVVVEREDIPTRIGMPWIRVHDGRRAAAVIAAAFHGWPAQSLQLLGVTGTNGKTTTVGLLRHVLDEPEAPCASIGTLGVLLGSEGAAMPGGQGLTTPGPVELQRVLRQLVQRGVRRVAMETSSHALDQRRVDGLAFAAAVFTNLTRDHLDYHGTMEAYRAAKLRLVALIDRQGTACVNADDPAWRDVASGQAPVRVLTFGLGAGADVSARSLTFTSSGAHFQLVAPMGAVSVALPLIGDFNVANALGVAAAALSIGVPLATVAERLACAPQVPGRLERIASAPTVLRDYAHTPDALERALLAVRPFTRGDETAGLPDGRLIVLFGCGGDRDRGKRPEMGRIAERLADVVIITSDNPRTEDPERILDDIAAGMSRTDIVREADRAIAIERALRMARPGDVVVLAGKGHETYQIRGTTSYPFDERDIVQELRAAMIGEAAT